MKDAVFVETVFYKFIYYLSTAFGTWMTITAKTHKVVAYTVSLSWCMAIVCNQIDYVMKPWLQEEKDKRKEDVTFEKIIRFDFWTYNVIYFMGCFFPLVGEKINVNTPPVLKSLTRDTWRIVIVSVLVVGNLTPTYFSYDFLNIQKKRDSKYNLFFQDICKLGMLTVDLQFVWFCWSLKDEFSKLNDDLQIMISSEDARPTAAAVVKARRKTVVTARNRDYRCEIYRINCAYGKLMYGVKNVRGVCEERILMNILCYMFNTICGLFDTISAYRTQGVPILLAIVHLLWVLNCAGRITLACFAASSVVEQDERLHDLARIIKETLDAKSDCWEMKHFIRRLTYYKVKFDFCGMVTIDKTLLASAVISVISYLVIVLQYNYS